MIRPKAVVSGRSAAKLMIIQRCIAVSRRECGKGISIKI